MPRVDVFLAEVQIRHAGRRRIAKRHLRGRSGLQRSGGCPCKRGGIAGRHNTGFGYISSLVRAGRL
jgi:hypothetical protein